MNIRILQRNGYGQGNQSSSSNNGVSLSGTPKPVGIQKNSPLAMASGRVNVAACARTASVCYGSLRARPGLSQGGLRFAMILKAVSVSSDSANPLADSEALKSSTALANDAVEGVGEQEDGEADWADVEAELDALNKLIGLLPESVRSAVEEHNEMLELLEVVMDLGRYPVARFPMAGDVKLSPKPVTQDDLDYAIAQVGEFGGDNRAGIDRTLHRISCIRNRTGRVVGLTCRVGRAIKGSASMVEDLVHSGASILFLGRPGVGKTTAIREVSRTLGDDLLKRVVIVDTSNEIGGDGDIPHVGIGRARRMQVADPQFQHNVMIEAVENHMPEVVIIDEISTEEECAAAKTIAQRGVQLVATAHGNELENVIKNPSLSDLVGGIQSVTLGDDEARRRGVQKSILERAGPPTFDVAVEMLERNKWRVHLDVAQAVDVILSGGQAGGQVRERAADGSILKYNFNHVITGALRNPTKDMTRSTSAAPAKQSSYSARDPGTGSSIDMDGPSSSGKSSSSYSYDPMLKGSRSSFSSSPSMEDMDDDDVDDGFGSTKLRKLRRRQSLVGVTPEEAQMRVYPYDLDTEKLWEVLNALKITHEVYISNRVEKSDAVLGLRSRIKSSAGLRQAAKEAGVPIYAVKSTATPNLVRAMRTLLGIDPSAGGAFASRSDDEDSDSPAGSFAPRAEQDIARMASTEYSSSKESLAMSEALDEALLAVQQIVQPLKQPAELMPQPAEIIEAQKKLLERCSLSYEVIGDGSSARLRIMP